MKPATILKQNGFMLFEPLIAIIVFSVGILGLVAFQAASVQNVSNAKFRSDASFLANQIIAEMWVSQGGAAHDVLTSFAYPPGGTPHPSLSGWAADVTAALPGANTNPPTIVVTGTEVTVTIRWKPPGEPVHTVISKSSITPA
jgi:type IV pilus assembly protein PilV